MRALELKGSYKIEDLGKLHKQAANKRTAQRLQAIVLKAEGKSTQEIARILRRSPKTIRTWIKLFNAGGPETLNYKHTGGPAGKLAPEQEQRLMLYLKEGRPDKRPWTLKTLTERLFEDCGVRLSKQQMSERIRRHGLRGLLSRHTANQKKKGRPIN